MANVTFRYKTGRVQKMERRYADVLQKLKYGTYQTRDMRAEEPVRPAEPEQPEEAKEAPEKEEAPKKRRSRRRKASN